MEQNKQYDNITLDCGTLLFSQLSDISEVELLEEIDESTAVR